MENSKDRKGYKKTWTKMATLGYGKPCAKLQWQNTTFDWNFWSKTDLTLENKGCILKKQPEHSKREVEE